MSDIQIRPATEADAPFLAWAMQEADRGHTGIGSWDIMIPGPDEERLAILEAVAREGEGTICHWSTFLIGEIGGVPSGTVAAFVPGQIPEGSFPAVMREITGRRGWSEQRLMDGMRGAYSKDFFTVPLPADTWRVEWVATKPEVRGRGLNRRLLEALLEWGRERGHKTSHVGTYIGNEPAIAAYKAAGFEIYAEARHADYERIFRSPGLVFFRRNL
jgi:GNAT superfamily N-acetyltransferase